MSSTTTSGGATITPLRHLPGHFYFADLHTTDVDAAIEFYRAFLGWETSEIPGAPMRYVTASIEGRLLARP